MRLGVVRHLIAHAGAQDEGPPVLELRVKLSLDAEQDVALDAPVIGPVPGRLTQTLSSDRTSPALIGAIETTVAYAKSMTGCSSGRIVFEPPRASHIAREPLIRSASSCGSMEMPVSGPGQAREIVKCFSSRHTPRATAPRHVQMPIE